MAMRTDENRKTAYDIYAAGFEKDPDSFYSNEAKEYFLRLRNAIIYELETTGFCTLIDSILESNMGRIDGVTYAALSDIYNGYQRNQLTDPGSNVNAREYIPWLKDWHSLPIPWNRAAYFGSLVYRLGKPETDMIRTIRSVIRKEHVRHVREQSFTESMPANPASLNDSAADVRIESPAPLINDPNQEAYSAAVAQAKKAAGDEAAKLAVTDADALITQYLADAQKKNKQEINAQLEAFSEHFFAENTRAAQSHQEMYDAANSFQAAWVTTLDQWVRTFEEAQTKAREEAVAQMNAGKADFYSHLHSWQAALNRRELGPIAERFLELYRIINVDRMIREEVVFKEEDAPRGGTIEGLQRLNNTLTTFLRRYEAALNSLDLYVYYPKTGDIFDELWHTPADDEFDYTGKPITECIVPGVAMKAKDEFGDDVLIPATVRAAMEN